MVQPHRGQIADAPISPVTKAAIGYLTWKLTPKSEQGTRADMIVGVPLMIGMGLLFAYTLPEQVEHGVSIGTRAIPSFRVEVSPIRFWLAITFQALGCVLFLLAALGLIKQRKQRKREEKLSRALDRSLSRRSRRR